MQKFQLWPACPVNGMETNKDAGKEYQEFNRALLIHDDQLLPNRHDNWQNSNQSVVIKKCHGRTEEDCNQCNTDHQWTFYIATNIVLSSYIHFIYRFPFLHSIDHLLPIIQNENCFREQWWLLQCTVKQMLNLSKPNVLVLFKKCVYRHPNSYL